MKLAPLMLMLIMLTGCVNYLRSYTFEETYVAVRKIDSKYDTAVHVEQLAIRMVPRDKIEPMLQDLRILRQKVNQSRSGPDATMIENFFLARMLMLESQRDFQIAAQIGLRGLVTDGYRCEEMESIAKSRIYLRDALAKGTLAMDHMDLVLQEPEGQRLLRINANKPRFYESPFRDISAERKAQRAALLKCMEEAGVTEQILTEQFGPSVLEDQS